VNALNKAQPRVPYRNSKLTRLLQDSLGGKSNAIMFANIAPAMQFYNDTFNTLNFASKSKKITNIPTVNIQYENHSFIEVQNVENKRSLETASFQAAKRHKTQDNKENLPNLELQLEQVLEKKGASLLSPFIKKHNLLPCSIVERLESLERQVAVQSAFTAQVVEPAPVPSQTNSSKLAVSKTPTSGVRTVKTLIVRGKELENAGDIQGATELYRQADEMLAYLQENAVSEDDKQKTESHRLKLAKKIEKLQLQNFMPVRKLALDFEAEETPVCNAEPKENALLRLLNTGSLKELTALKGIGQKRAQKIIDQRAVQSFKEVSCLVSLVLTVFRLPI